MGYLLNTSLAVLSIGLVEAGLARPWGHPLFLLPLLLLPGLGHLLLWRFGHLRAPGFLIASVLTIWPLAYQVLAVLFFQWSDVLGALLDPSRGLDAWPHPSLLLHLLPFLAATLFDIRLRSSFAFLSPAGLARLDQGSGWRVGLTRLNPFAAKDPNLAASERSFRSLQVRLFMSTLAPIVLFVLLTWPLGWNSAVRVRVEEVSLWSGAFLAFVGLSFALCLPFLLAKIWRAQPMPRDGASGDLRGLLELAAERMQFRFRQIMVLPTGYQLANAAILGVSERTRVVLFTDSLMNRLTPEELLAVFGHEMGHAKGRHVLVFLAWTIGFVLLGDMVVLSLAEHHDGSPLDEFLLWSVPVSLLAVWYFFFGYLSRRAELEADLHGLRTSGSPLPLMRALFRITGVQDQKRKSWRYFSVAKRQAFLSACALEPQKGQRLHRQLRWLGGIGLLFFVTMLGLRIVRSVRDWPAENFVVDLRSGAYGQAHKRVSSISEAAWTRHFSDELDRGTWVGALDKAGGKSVAQLIDVARSLWEKKERSEAAALVDLVGLCEGVEEPLALIAEHWPTAPDEILSRLGDIDGG